MSDQYVNISQSNSLNRGPIRIQSAHRNQFECVNEMRTTRDKSSKYSAAIPMRFKSSRLGCLSLAFIMAISACSKLGVESSEIEDLESGVRITGAVEKGPFILGSSVEISAADNNGISTGQVYQTHTKNDLGEFEIQINHRGPISIKGEGFYFNELLGELSWANMTCGWRCSTTRWRVGPTRW